MKTKLTIIILLACQLPVFGQHFFGMKLNGGISYIKTVISEYPPIAKTQKFYPVLSGQGGFTYNFVVKNRFLIGTELLFLPILGHEYLKYPTGAFNNGTFINDGGYSEMNTFLHIYNLGLPIYFGYNYKRLNLNIGFQTNFVLASGGRVSGQILDKDQLYTWSGSANGLEINKHDFGGRVGIFYKLSEKYNIEANYYYGLTNLIKDEQLAKSTEWRVQQLTLGLRYNLLTLERKTGETQKK